jgi:small-conductance mechanosensitive channel
MRSSTVPLKYFLILLAILFGIIIIDLITGGSLKPVASMGNTVLLAFFILIVYTIGVSLIVRKIPDEASRFTALRIFMTILLALGAFLVMAAWTDDPGQIVITLGIIWGAMFIAMRDLIQNIVGSLMLLITGVYRIGDRIRMRGVYGLVMDIGFFRTTLMELDHEAGDRPTGEIITVPNGILFREMVTNTSRHLSVISDEIRITLPFTADLERARGIVSEVIGRHTAEIESRATREIEDLGEKKFLPSFETRPVINLLVSDRGIVLIVKYITASEERAAIKTRIVEDLSQHLPGILEIRR